VLVVGGGPAGSSCASVLVRAGLDVVVLDRARFPRDKVCAGWITPAACDALALNLDEYQRGRTLQAFSGFQTGPLTGRMRLTDYGRVVSYGIRRCEFDTYLLERSGAVVLDGQPLTTLRRVADGWIVNDTIHAAMIVGAGGHFCPVARHLNSASEDDAVVAQEVEYELAAHEVAACRVAGEHPQLFFWPDLRGYGWVVRKGAYLNVGAGRLREGRFPSSVQEFVASLEARGMLPPGLPSRWKGHAYLLYRSATRALVSERALLVGDAAGCALAPSGEGILAAIESGQLAGTCIVQAKRGYTHEALGGYARAITARFGRRLPAGEQAPVLPGWLGAWAARALLGTAWGTRRWVIEEGFLHPRRPPLSLQVPV
jgi:flavin-dependent dehydrogenase